MVYLIPYLSKYECHTDFVAGVNTCRHCRGKGTCYRAVIPYGLLRKVRYSCDSCIREEGFENAFEAQKVVNCNVCRGSGLLPGANTFFQEYIKPKTFKNNDEKEKLPSASDERKLLGE